MITIHKYELEITDYQFIDAPSVFRALDVQVQNGKICLWAIVDDKYAKKATRISIVGTGNPAQHIVSSEYIGTVQDNGFVWHVFQDLL